MNKNITVFEQVLINVSPICFKSGDNVKNNHPKKAMKILFNTHLPKRILMAFILDVTRDVRMIDLQMFKT